MVKTGFAKEFIPADLMSEKQLQSVITQLLKVLGYEVFHPWLSIHSPSGYPDLTAVNPNQKRIVWIELKREDGKLTSRQQEWIELLKKAGAEVYIWRPSDWFSGKLEQILTTEAKGG